MVAQRKKKLYHDANLYLWDNSYMFKVDYDVLIGRCVVEKN